jgi:hypothetical protein
MGIAAIDGTKVSRFTIWRATHLGSSFECLVKLSLK